MTRDSWLDLSAFRPILVAGLSLLGSVLKKRSQGVAQTLSDAGGILEVLKKCGLKPLGWSPANRRCDGGSEVRAVTGRPRGMQSKPGKYAYYPSRLLTAGANSVPRAGFTCVSYLPGHDVHYIPVLKLSATRSHAPAKLDFTGDSFRLQIADESHLARTHNPEALRRLIEGRGGACRWYPSFSYASWPAGEVRHWVNLSLEELTPCISREEALLIEWETCR